MSNYPIQPEHIDMKKDLAGIFGNWPNANAAKTLVLFAQMRGDGWSDFTQDDIDNFASPDFSFHCLAGKSGSLIQVNVGEKTFSFTHYFVAMCFSAAPAILVVA